MTRASENIGTCFLCHQIFTSRAIARHLNEYIDKVILTPKTTDKLIEIFRIKLSAGPLFWLYVDIPATASLENLDHFLRTTWLECCSHLSQFMVHGEGIEDMSKSIHRMFTKGTLFSYQYDFGSTTELEGKVIAIYQGHLNEKVHCLARNSMPTFHCNTCSRAAESICSICFDCCCKKCRQKHGCRDNEVMLPVVNSPRMGICGYTGENRV